MAEKEKCEQGLLYNPNHDQELIHLREHFKELCSQYNQLQYSDIETRKALYERS